MGSLSATEIIRRRRSDRRRRRRRRREGRFSRSARKELSFALVLFGSRIHFDDRRRRTTPQHIEERKE
jgi:hypothetical protein